MTLEDFAKLRNSCEEYELCSKTIKIYNPDGTGYVSSHEVDEFYMVEGDTWEDSF